MDEIQRLGNRQIAEIGNINAADGNCEADGRKPLSMTGIARNGAHVILNFITDPTALGIVKTSLQIVYDTFEFRFVSAVTEAVVTLDADFLPFCAVKQDVNDVWRQFFNRRIKRKMVMLCKPFHVHGGNGVTLHGPSAGFQAAAADGKRLVRQNALRVDFHKNAEARALGAGAERAVKRKHARGQFFYADPVLRAGVILRKKMILTADDVYNRQAAGKRRRRFNRIRQARTDIRMNDEAVNDNFNRMLLVLFQTDGFRKVVKGSVDAHTNKAAPPGRVKFFDVFPFSGPHNRRENENFCFPGQGKDLVDNLVDRLLPDFPAANGAVRNADARVKQTEVIVNFGHGANGGTRVFRRCFLVDGNGGRQPVDVVHIGLVDLAEELAGIGGERLHVAPLALRVNGVKRKRRFSGAGKSRKNNQLIPRQLNVDILEVVLPRALDENSLC